MCLVVRKLMDALKDEMDTQGCVARRCRRCSPVPVLAAPISWSATLPPEGNEHLMLCSLPPPLDPGSLILHQPTKDTYIYIYIKF